MPQEIYDTLFEVSRGGKKALPYLVVLSHLLSACDAIPTEQFDMEVDYPTDPVDGLGLDQTPCENIGTAMLRGTVPIVVNNCTDFPVELGDVQDTLNAAADMETTNSGVELTWQLTDGTDLSIDGPIEVTPAATVSGEMAIIDSQQDLQVFETEGIPEALEGVYDIYYAATARNEVTQKIYTYIRADELGRGNAPITQSEVDTSLLVESCQIATKATLPNTESQIPVELINTPEGTQVLTATKNVVQEYVCNMWGQDIAPSQWPASLLEIAKMFGFKEARLIE